MHLNAEKVRHIRWQRCGAFPEASIARRALMLMRFTKLRSVVRTPGKASRSLQSAPREHASHTCGACTGWTTLQALSWRSTSTARGCRARPQRLLPTPEKKLHGRVLWTRPGSAASLRATAPRNCWRLLQWRVLQRLL